MDYILQGTNAHHSTKHLFVQVQLDAQSTGITAISSLVNVEWTNGVTTVYLILYQSSKFDQKQGDTCLTYDILYKRAQPTLSSPDIFWSQYTLCNILHFPHLSWKAGQHNLGPN